MPVIKHNKLIETSYKLNSREQFFVLYLISQISQGAQGFEEYTMHYSEREGILNFDGKRRIANRSEVFMLMDRLNSEPIVYEMGNIIGKSVWLQHMEHNKDTDEFTFRLSEKLREYLLQLKEHFTKYNLINIAYLNGNAVRLYELLKRHQYQGECEFTIEKLKFFLGIENSYPKFYDFKRWVLLPSQKDIAKYTDIGFKFRPGKKKRKKILSLQFSIFDNEPEYEPEIIHLFKKIEKIDGVGESPELEQQKLIDLYQQQETSNLTRSQILALAFLGSKGVNQGFILQQILAHKKVKYEPLRGYEDIYIKQIWQFFYSKSKATKKAGAFVNWWKNGRLTADNFHARMIEMLVQKKKGMSMEEQQKRNFAKQMRANDFENEWRKHTEKVVSNFQHPTHRRFNAPTERNVIAKKYFIFNNFKQQYPAIYRKIQANVTREYQDTFNSLGQSFDLKKYKEAIESRTEGQCKTWWKQQVGA